MDALVDFNSGDLGFLAATLVAIAQADRETGENTPGRCDCPRTCRRSNHDSLANPESRRWSNDLAVRIILSVMLVSVLGVCKPDRTNVSAGRRENARGTTQKTGDANDHLSP